MYRVNQIFIASAANVIAHGSSSSIAPRNRPPATAAAGPIRAADPVDIGGPFGAALHGSRLEPLKRARPSAVRNLIHLSHTQVKNLRIERSMVARVFTREEFYELVWSKPMTHLAKEFAISDVALHKICKKHDIPNPPLGWWAKKAAGKKVKRAAAEC